jgi:hypothetical protein
MGLTHPRGGMPRTPHTRWLTPSAPSCGGSRHSTAHPSSNRELLLFGLGNGIAFVPLTTAALDGVAPEDAGAASGLLNAMQQIGGSLGLAVLVTVVGTASTNAARHVTPGESAAQVARHVFTVGADRAFLVAAMFLAATVLLTWFAIRPTTRQTTDSHVTDDTVPVEV